MNEISSYEPSAGPHVPVLMNEVLSHLSPMGSETYIDGTFGAGGYSRGILEAAPNCSVIAFDRDEDAIERGQSMVAAYEGRFDLVHKRFSEILKVLEGRKVDGLVLDLGVSSPQIDQAERGFSFQKDGPLDMRMGLNAQTAAEVVNTYEEEELATLFYRYGEERFSRRIARQIVENRLVKPFTRTLELASVVAKSIPKSRHEMKIHPATRVFQALRIYVNEELKEIETVLAESEDILAPGGRLVVVSFHSLEDRLVKLFLRKASGRGAAISRYLPDKGPEDEERAIFEVLTKKAVSATDEEARSNPRARSAKLRAARRVGQKQQEKGAS